MAIENKRVITDSELKRAIERVANAITANAGPGRDETGGRIESLTEAVMGMTAGLCRIADALDGVADAIRNNQDNEGLQS